MILSRFARKHGADTIGALYGAIVAQARSPVFYASFGIPDTPESRFEMIVLHVALFFRRLRAETGPLRELGQGVFDRFCSDMEANLREMGVSDLAVPQSMRRIGEAFYGRARAYDHGLAADDGGLTAALARNIAPGRASVDFARLAAYTRMASADLACQSGAAFASGIVAFPDPGAMPVRSATP